MKKFTQKIVIWLIAIEFAIEVLRITKPRIHPAIGITWSDHPSYSLEDTLTKARRTFEESRYNFEGFTIEEIDQLEESTNAILRGFESIRSNGFEVHSEDQSTAYYWLCEYPSIRLRKIVEEIAFDDLDSVAESDLYWLEDNRDRIAQPSVTMVETVEPSSEDIDRLMEIIEAIRSMIPNLREAIITRDAMVTMIPKIDRLMEAIAKNQGCEYPLMINGLNCELVDSHSDITDSISELYSKINPSDSMIDLLRDIQSGYLPSKSFEDSIIRTFVNESNHHRVYRIMNSSRLILEGFVDGWSLLKPSSHFNDLKTSIEAFSIIGELRYPNNDPMIGQMIRDIGLIVEAIYGRRSIIDRVKPSIDSLEDEDREGWNIAHRNLAGVIHDLANVTDPENHLRDIQPIAKSIEEIANTKDSKTLRESIDDLDDRVGGFTPLIPIGCGKPISVTGIRELVNKDIDDTVDRANRRIQDFIAVEDFRSSLKSILRIVDEDLTRASIFEAKSRLTLALEGWVTSIGYSFANNHDLSPIDDLEDLIINPSIEDIRHEKSRLQPSMVE